MQIQMRLVTTHETAVILRRAIENMLEGSEKIMILCNGSSPCVEFQIVDALWICSVSLKIQKDGFQIYQVKKSEHYVLQSDLRPLHYFLKQNADANALSFECEGEQNDQWTIKALSQHRRVLKTFIATVSEDNTPYISMSSKMFQNWNSFSMDPQEFSNITLDLAVGGGLLDLHLHANNMVTFKSQFQTGEIAFHTENKDVSTKTQISRKRKRNNSFFHVHRTTHRRPRWIHGRYIIKFLKLICGVTPLCEKLSLYLRNKHPLILKLRFSDCIHMIVSIVPE